MRKRSHQPQGASRSFRRLWACMIRPTLKVLLAVIALVWGCTYLLRPRTALQSLLASADRQQVLLQDQAVDVQNLWQYQLASFQLPHPLLPPDAVAVVC